MSSTVKKAPKRQYVIDNIGNRLSITNNSESTEYIANSLNQYSDIDGTNLTYDLDGNLLSNNGWTYTWNGENRLISASNATQVLTFAYDYMGRRFAKTVDGSETKFIYNGWNLIQESNNSTTNNYVWGLDLSGGLQGAGGIGGLLSVSEDDGAVYFPVADANGNITGYIDDAGTVKAVYTFDAFGSIIDSTGSKVDDFKFRFSSKYQDETELSYYGYRYYDAELGRWISKDPIEENGGLNLYGFVGNNGVDGIDAFGFRVVLPSGDVLVNTVLPEGFLDNNPSSAPYYQNMYNRLDAGWKLREHVVMSGRYNGADFRASLWEWRWPFWDYLWAGAAIIGEGSSHGVSGGIGVGFVRNIGENWTSISPENRPLGLLSGGVGATPGGCGKLVLVLLSNRVPQIDGGGGMVNQALFPKGSSMAGHRKPLYLGVKTSGFGESIDETSFGLTSLVDLLDSYGSVEEAYTAARRILRNPVSARSYLEPILRSQGMYNRERKQTMMTIWSLGTGPESLLSGTRYIVR